MTDVVVIETLDEDDDVIPEFPSSGRQITERRGVALYRSANYTPI